jgi:hypothetical protein
MIERVIYCAIGSLAMLSPLPHETLLKRDAGVVAAVRDDTMLTLLSRQADVSVLYFSRDDYDEAIRGLSKSEIDSIVNKRLQYWAPNAAGHGLSWIYHTAQRDLTLTALAQTSRARVAGTRLADHFEQILQLLVTISGESRYQDMTMASLLVLVVEGEANLRAEYLDAQKAAQQAGDSVAAERFAFAAKRSEEYCQALGPTLRSLGRPEYSQSLPHIGLSRGTFVWPRDPDLIKRLTAQQVIHVIWKDGLVAEWSLDDFPELEKRGKSSRVLYFNSGKLLMDLQDLTPAQLARELAKRFEAGQGASMEARREHLCSFWLAQHVLRRKALARSRESHTAASALLERQVTEEERALQQELAAHPVWLEEREKSFGLEALKKSEEQLLQDARFFGTLCRREGDANGEALFKKVSAFKPAQP